MSEAGTTARRDGICTVTAWSRPGQALALLLRGHTVRTAAPVALLVGTVLPAVNRSDVILWGHATADTWIRVAVNYLIPFTVASWACLSARRVPRAPDHTGSSGTDSP